MIEGYELPGGPESIRDLDSASWNPKEILGDLDLERPVPLRALLLSFAALFVPILVAVFYPVFASGDIGLLVWLTALVPAFLLTYYRGWFGASLALAMGMAALALVQAALLLAGIQVSNWGLLAGTIVVYVATSLGIGWLTEVLHSQRRIAAQLALTDSLTGMPNRRHAVVFLEVAFAAARRGVPLSVTIFDVDKFKLFNDTRGHIAGDEALRKLAGILKASTRRMNLSARWGGEEFVSLLSETPVEGGLIYAERIISEIHSAFPRGDVRVSAGVAGYSKEMDSPARLLAAADRAMRAAKDTGGDCARVAPKVPEAEGEP
jgi:diguanylate cyclase (GGDEF)-like protein